MEKILVIEDEKLIREGIAEILELEGFEVLQASNGKEGLEMTRTHFPDLIVCDVKMPVIDGHLTLQALRKDPETAKIPFIFLSALVSNNDIRTGMNLGADDYIPKPFEPNELIRAVKTRLFRSKELKDRMEGLKESILLSLPHEFRTPLVGIIGYSQILLDKFSDEKSSEFYEFAREIHTSGLRLNKLIQQYITYTNLVIISSDPKSFLEKNKILSTIPADYVENIVLKIAERYNRRKDLQYEIENIVLNITPNYVGIIIEELVDNAFKFSSQGTPVIVSLKANADGVRFVVKDNGRGIKEEQVSNISAFIQFERNQFEQQGMGLGIATSKKIIELFSGKLEYKSEYTKFTEVTVEFPV
ncbi:MAG: hybrid sensor histidine kinase/response regulator [Ignavibacteriaceae bacterium]|nr:hybrid sensor histidine kinase/response regulator [Ignavibacteriaceae bacterium]